jgi:8-oxo-dGTP pyrophosphatase MutT (NUDIX family)
MITLHYNQFALQIGNPEESAAFSDRPVHDGIPAEVTPASVLSLFSSPASFVKTDDCSELMDKLKALFLSIQAAGGVVVDSANNLLFIHRFGKWDLPKGKMEENEQPLETAMREIQEETGVVGLQYIDILPTSWHIYPMGDAWVLKETHWFLFSCEQDVVLKPQIEESIDRVQWIASSDVSVPLTNTYENIRMVVQQALLRLPLSR